MKPSRLEAILQSLDDFEDPDITLEQYATTPHIACKSLNILTSINVPEIYMFLALYLYSIMHKMTVVLAQLAGLLTIRLSNSHLMNHFMRQLIPFFYFENNAVDILSMYLCC